MHNVKDSIQNAWGAFWKLGEAILSPAASFCCALPHTLKRFPGDLKRICLCHHLPARQGGKGGGISPEKPGAQMAGNTMGHVFQKGRFLRREAAFRACHHRPRQAPVRLPTLPQFPSLNVSNAAAVALYEMRRGSFS